MTKNEAPLVIGAGFLCLLTQWVGIPWYGALRLAIVAMIGTLAAYRAIKEKSN